MASHAAESSVRFMRWPSGPSSTPLERRPRRSRLPRRRERNQLLRASSGRESRDLVLVVLLTSSHGREYALLLLSAQGRFAATNPERATHLRVEERELEAGGLS